MEQANVTANTILKVGAFIIRKRTNGPHQLLLFTHPDYPDAPIQIPGGTVETDEHVDSALHREIEEETGLRDLAVIRKLGVSKVLSMFNSGGTLERHCYLLEAPSDHSEKWIHIVSGSGEDNGIRFEFAWRTIDDPRFTLCGDLGYFLKPQHIPELYSDSGPPIAT